MPFRTQNSPIPKYYTVNEVAQILRRKPNTVRDWVAPRNQGKGLDHPPFIKDKGRILFSCRGFDQWIEAQTRKGE